MPPVSAGGVTGGVVPTPPSSVPVSAGGATGVVAGGADRGGRRRGGPLGALARLLTGLAFAGRGRLAFAGRGRLAHGFRVPAVFEAELTGGLGDFRLLVGDSQIELRLRALVLVFDRGDAILEQFVVLLQLREECVELLLALIGRGVGGERLHALKLAFDGRGRLGGGGERVGFVDLDDRGVRLHADRVALSDEVFLRERGRALEAGGPGQRGSSHRLLVLAAAAANHEHDDDEDDCDRAERD